MSKSIFGIVPRLVGLLQGDMTQTVHQASDLELSKLEQFAHRPYLGIGFMYSRMMS